MESSDDGDSSTAAIVTKATIIFLFVLPLACYKSPFTEKLQTHLPTETAKTKTVSTPVKKKSKKKKLYLTFDDGPNREQKMFSPLLKMNKCQSRFSLWASTYLPASRRKNYGTV